MMIRFAPVLAASAIWLSSTPVFGQDMYQGKDCMAWGKLINDLDPTTRKTAYDAMKAFAKRNDRTAVGYLVDAAVKQNADVRPQAVAALGQIGMQRSDQDDLFDAALTALADIIVNANEKSPDLRIAAAQSLGQIAEKSRDHQAVLQLKSTLVSLKHTSKIVGAMAKAKVPASDRNAKNVQRKVFAFYSKLSDQQAVLLAWSSSGVGDLRIVIPDPYEEAVMRALGRVAFGSDVVGEISGLGGKLVCTIGIANIDTRFDEIAAAELDPNAPTVSGTEIIRIQLDFTGAKITEAEFAGLMKNKIVVGMNYLLENLESGSGTHVAMDFVLSRTRLGNAAFRDWGLFTNLQLERGFLLAEEDPATRKKNRQKLLAQDFNGITVDLSGSQITDEGLAGLCSLSETEELDLANTRIRDAGIRNLLCLRKLNKLVLANTRITDGGTEWLGLMGKLGKLDLSGTRISDTGLRPLKRIALTELNLAGNRIGDDGIACLFLGKMTSLNLAGTSVGDRTLEQLAAVNEIASLNLSRTRVTDHGLANLASMRHTLKSLDLSGTYVGDEGLALVCQSGMLETLNLSNTLVGDASLDRLVNLQKLTKLNLSETGISNRGLDELGRLAGILGFNGEKSELQFNKNRVSYDRVQDLRAHLHNHRPKATVYFLRN